MGCDIHMYKEKLVNGAWVAADKWVDDQGYVDVPWEQRFTDRNYNLFGVLAKVRREYPCSIAPRGIPSDACKPVAGAAKSWGSDGHSHSHLLLSELRGLQALLSTTTLPISGLKHRDELQKLRDSIAGGAPDWSLLYPYCQGTNSPDYEAFEIEVPMSFVVGDALDRIVASFDGVDGDNHRIVFWFDN